MKLILTILSTVLLAQKAFCLTVPSGTTYTLSNVNLTEDVIVEPLATLIIDGNVTFGHPVFPGIEYKIEIRDHGRLFSNGGSIKGLNLAGVQRNWLGIYPDATPLGSPSTSEAIHLEAFTIEHSVNGIYSSRSGLAETVALSRKMYFKNVTFKNCGRFVSASNDFTSVNRVNAVNPIEFIGCHFLKNTRIWPIHISNHNDITFRNCLFSYNETNVAEIGIHVNSVQDFKVFDSHFRLTGQVGIVFHGTSYDAIIERNSFNISGTSPADYAAIGVGYAVNIGRLYNASISKNSFYSAFEDQEIYGIAVGPGYSPDNDYFGVLGNAVISNNSFFGTKYALSVTNDEVMSGGSVSSLQIKKNTFKRYKIAIHLDDNHQATYANCNYMYQNNSSTGIALTSYITGTTLPIWGFADPANQFLNGGLDFDNQTTTNFDMYSSASNPNQPFTFSGPVTPYSTLSLYNCGGKLRFDQKTTENEVVIYPNPTSGKFRIENLTSIDGEASIFISDVSGKLIYNTEKNNNETLEIDLTNSPAGIYFIKIVNAMQSVTKQLVKD